MHLKALKTLTFAILLTVFVKPIANAQVQECGLKPEKTPFQLTPPKRRVEIRWGENTPDFVRLISRLQKNGPMLTKSLLGYLDFRCREKTRSKTQPKACEFPALYSKYTKTQRRLEKMLAAQTFEMGDDHTEPVFRALNWTTTPFAESSTSDDPQGEAVRTLVEWMVLRRQIRAKLSDVDADMRSVSGPRAPFRQTHMPALKAHFASPLLVGQVADFVRSQDCGTNPVCQEANRQLRVWLVEQLQPIRDNLSKLKCILESPSEEVPSIELQKIKDLYREDSAFAQGDAGVVEAYMKFLESSTLTRHATDQSDLAKARIGTVIVSEILHIFESSIAAQAPLTSEIIHREIAPLEKRIQKEIQEPIFDLQDFLFKSEEGVL